MLVLVVGCGEARNGGVGSTGGSGNASQGVVSTGAQLGYAWMAADSSIRPIYGVPGASRFAAPVGPAPGEFVSAAIANSSGVALLQDGKGNLSVMTLPSGAPDVLARSLTQPLQIAFSRSGNYAIGFSSGSASMLTISGLPSAPSAMAVTANASLQAATISDQGNILLALANSAGGTTVSLASTGHALLQLGAFGGFAYLPGVDNAVIADSIANTVTLVKSVSTQPISQTLSIPSGLLNKPFAVQTSADGHWALVANSGDNSIIRVDLTNTTPPVKVSSPVPVTQLLPWTGTASFALTSPTSGPVWMLSASDATPRVLFVPAPVIAEASNASAMAVAAGRRSR